MKKTRRDLGRPRGASIVSAVFNATLLELAEHGFEGLSVARVAARADVNKTSVYRRYPTRASLVSAAFEQMLDALSLRAADTGSLAGDLHSLMRQVATVMDSPTGKALLRAAFAEEAHGVIAALANSRSAQSATGPILELVARAIARGELHATVAPDQLLFGLVGAMIHRLVLERGEVTDAWLASMIGLFTKGCAVCA